jgi:hypothetical protein
MSQWGILDNNLSKPKYLNRGQIVAVNVTNGGSAYGAAPTVTISAPASGTQATATANITGGVVTSITITNPGAGYKSTDTVTVTFSSGAATATAVYHGAAYNDGHIFFVDREESQLSENRAKGLMSPGWWLYRTFTDAQSLVRHKSELLVAMDVVVATSGDANDDATVVDRMITITTQPANLTRTAPATATFTVVAAAAPTAALTYQWQRQANGAGPFNNIGGATSASYTTPATSVVSNNQDRYRVLVSATGATTVTSTAAILTVV